ncbi:Alpha/beta hydrolase family protein [Agromyces sp. CF514]|uniref:alpha/beta hydrolase family protein n=1 Tax=Agromyces sp. CF514 TaxID=1881031 RepID=UPI0008E99A17|nr:alpha/beta fold hydrolase [Agromyces sp. CF514]SFR66778.1 Alpha/beta hydrolase family protein [Agromyces sp. CF514]
MSAPASDTSSIPVLAEPVRVARGARSATRAPLAPATAPPATPPALRAVAGGIRLASSISPELGARLALPLFMHVGRRARVASADLATHDEARRGSVRIPGIRRSGVDVVTYEWGGGPDTVVLAHGWQSRASVFASLVRELRSEGFRVVAFDAPANGDSPGRGTYLVDHLDILAALQQRHGRFHALVGHSFGGMATLLAPGEGIDARRVAAIAGAGSPDVFIDGFGEMVGLGAPTRAALASAFARRLFADDEDPFDRYSALAHPLPDGTPLLLVHDRGDRRVPFAEAPKIAAANPASTRLVPTDGLGHNRILRADVTLDAVVDFVTASDAALTPAV